VVVLHGDEVGDSGVVELVELGQDLVLVPMTAASTGSAHPSRSSMAR
jgi:hypothetical protein